MKNVLYKDLFREIKKTKSRFFSIVAIVALGSSFFCGIKITCPDMKATADKYYDETKLADFHLVSTYGITEDDIAKINNLLGISGVMPGYSKDVFLEDDENSAIVRLFGLQSERNSENPNYLNQVTLLEGKLPTNKHECAIESNFVTPSSFYMGNTISFNAGKEEDLSEDMTATSCEIVGIVRSSSYVTFEKGSTNIGNGQLSNYVIVDESMFDMEVYTDLYVQIDSLRNVSAFSSTYETLIESFQGILEDLAIIQSDVRYSDIYNEAINKINDAQLELDEKEVEANQELNDALKKINDAQRDINDGKKTLVDETQKAHQEIADGEKKLIDGEKEYDENYLEYLQKMTDAEVEIEKNEQILKDGWKEFYIGYQSFLDSSNSATLELNKQQQSLNGAKSILSSAISGGNEATIIATAGGIIQSFGQTVTGSKDTDIAICHGIFQSVQQALDNGWKQLANAEIKLDAAEAKLLDGDKELAKAKVDLAQAKIDAEKEFSDALIEMEDGKREIADAKITLAKESAKANKEIYDGSVKLADARVQYNDAKDEADTKIGDAKVELSDARADLAKLEKPKWYVFDRNNQPGYGDYGNDAERIDKIAAVFPIFFILVAMLICLTTMSRMVEEQRGQIGTLKAMGYDNSTIMKKYIIYALLASLIGCAIGLSIGFVLFPTIIFDAYKMMYIFPDIVTPFDIPMAIGATLVATTCTCIAAYLAGRKELCAQPSQLMRPKTPKAGQRILLERFDFLWRRLSFSYKVTIRNIARYKSRIFLTVVGIGGCSALMLTGFGIRDSISGIVDKQYDDIFHYDLIGALNDNLTTKEESSINEILNSTPKLEDYMYVYYKNIDIKINKDTRSVTLFVPNEVDEIDKFITLKQRVNQNPLTLKNDGVIINEKLARVLGVKVNDYFEIEDNGVKANVMVSGICENYAMNYIYMTPQFYEKTFETTAKENVFIGNILDFNEENQSEVASALMEEKNIIGISYTSEIGDKFSNMIDSLNVIIIVIIVCSGLLAFIVLYNLTNINVNERMRELATIKVLGFYDNEVSAYVYRENTFSSVVGVLFGLFMGIYLHRFVIQTAEVEMVMFDPNIKAISFVIAAILTLVFTLIVNFVLHFKLKKIDMVESLKSVE